jgi:hypothetical protein
MLRPFVIALLPVTVLAACDDARVRDVSRREFVTREYLIGAFRAGSLQVEVHGAPWDGATPDEIAGTLRMPEGAARELRFRAIAPGDPVVGDGERLILRFNPDGGIDHDAACRKSRPLPTAAPRDDRFTVEAIYCRGSGWITIGRMDARVDATDWLNYYLVMQTLFARMFPAG